MILSKEEILKYVLFTWISRQSIKFIWENKIIKKYQLLLKYILYLLNDIACTKKIKRQSIDPVIENNDDIFLFIIKIILYS